MALTCCLSRPFLGTEAFKPGMFSFRTSTNWVPSIPFYIEQDHRLRHKQPLKINRALVVDTMHSSIEEISHNQVLMSFLLACALAQLLKPLTSLLGGKGFNWRLVLKSGGMPSSHAAGAAAAAAAVGLERGFSDAVFGFSVVMALVIMYDAQGVRRAVGKQAEVINTMVFSFTPNNNNNSSSSSSNSDKSTPMKVSVVTSVSSPPDDADNAMQGPYTRSNRFFRRAEKLPSVQEGEVDIQEIGDEHGWRHIPLKESVGHTKLQVLAGAALGVALAIAFHS